MVIARIRRVVYGTKVSLARTIGYSVYYIVFSLLVISSSFFIQIPYEYFVAYAAMFFAAFYFAYRFARTRLVFWKGEDGAIYSKGGLPIYLTYVVGLILRLTIGYIFIGPSYFDFNLAQTAPLGPVATLATIVTDLILVLGTGLLVGRNMHILTEYRAIKAGKKEIIPKSRDAEA